MRGYNTYPDISGNKVIFVSDDDIWSMDLDGGKPRRLTNDLGVVSSPRFSRDGRHIAFCASLHSGAPATEVYVIPSEGGDARRLTYYGSPMTGLAGWTDRGEVAVATDSGTPFVRWRELVAITPDGKKRRPLNLGPASHVEYDKGRVLLGRNTEELLFWKHYKGGRRGKLWIDRNGKGNFTKFQELDGNITSPMFLGDRVYFICDHEGSGNIYSVDLNGRRIKRHTKHSPGYARNARTDGKRIVYQSDGDIYLFDPVAGSSKVLDIDLPANRQGRAEKFVKPLDFTEDYSLSPAGERLSFIVRGKAFAMGNWEGAVVQLGKRNGVRYKNSRFNHDGKTISVVSDEGGEEHVEVYGMDGARKSTFDIDFGLIESIEPSPAGNSVAVTNNRFELFILDLSTKKAKRIDRSEVSYIEDVAWSFDGRHIAYSKPESENSSRIRIADTRTGRVEDVTTPNSFDFSPAFDPEGKYLYFLSSREVNPVYDKIVFDLGFPLTVKPFVATLRKDVQSPFLPSPRPLTAEKGDEKASFAVDMDGIAERVEAFPVDEGNYAKIAGTKGRALFLSFPVEGAKRFFIFSHGRRKGTLSCYNFSDQTVDKLASGVSDFRLSGDSSAMLLRTGEGFRVLKSGEKADKEREKESHREPGRKSGLVDLDRIKVKVDIPSEWRQMLQETWRRMRENFWRRDLRGVNWPSVLKRYQPMIDRIGSRSELSEVLKEMQGELGTSHSYEMGGDYSSRRSYSVGSLGASLEHAREGYRITEIFQGDPTNEGERSPLNGPGISLRKGDVLLSINGMKLDAENTPEKLLENHAGEPVTVTALKGGRKSDFTVRTLRDDKFLLYRSWVESNRKLVHEKTHGRVGYVHIPDMGPNGYGEFHRLYAVESEREGMIVDVRYNRGGHVSALLLEKLNRKRIAYARPRRGRSVPYPRDSVKGPMVALTNENAGSDGDIFSHGFKLFKLGPLIGTRTWGGVIGINPRSTLVDGTFVTQPQMAFWFKDVKWGVENYGTDPTIEVEMYPQDYTKGKDVQLQRGIEEINRLLKNARGMLQEPEDPSS